MNIVILSDTGMVNGGAAKIALDGARSLAAAGHQVHLVVGAGPAEQELQHTPHLTIHCLGDFDIVTDPNRLRAMALGWWNPRARRYVGALLDSMDPEATIVHLHSWTKALSSSAVRAVVDRGFEIVVTIHDFLLTCPTGTLFLQNTQQKCSLRPLSAACLCTNCDVQSYHHKLWRVGRRLIQDRYGHIPSGLRHFIVYSQLSQDLLKPYISPDSNFHFVPNAVEMQRQFPAQVSENETFMFLGRLTPEKGAAMFARAAAAEQVRCQFVGNGSAQSDIARANPNAVLSGWMNQRDGVEALRSARALVFPSLWYETLGLVVLEAAGNGVPSIVPDSSAARESVIDGVTGLYFRSGNERDLRAKIAALKDPALAASLGRAAYERFWSPPGMSLDLHRRRLETTYDTILSMRHQNSETASRTRYAAV